MFADNSPNDDEKISPFGIHQICKEAKKSGNISPGEWYGPNMISIVLRNLCNNLAPIKDFQIHVSQDGNIMLNKIRQQIVENKAALLVLVPVRLGLQKIQDTYINQIKSIFQFEQNVGIAGGEDMQAFYFVGFK